MHPEDELPYDIALNIYYSNLTTQKTIVDIDYCKRCSSSGDYVRIVYGDGTSIIIYHYDLVIKQQKKAKRLKI